MKVIDLLNKIANNEEVPKEVKFRGELCSFDNEDKDYYCQEYGYIVWHLIDTGNNMNEVLDTKLEIIEEKPKKIVPMFVRTEGNEFVIDKMNELIEAVNYLLEKESDK